MASHAMQGKKKGDTVGGSGRHHETEDVDQVWDELKCATDGGDGKSEISVTALLALVSRLARSRQADRHAPTSFLVRSLVLTGRTGSRANSGSGGGSGSGSGSGGGGGGSSSSSSNEVDLKLSLTISSLSAGWASIALLPSSVSIRSSSVTDTSLPLAGARAGADRATADEPNALLGVVDGSVALLTRRAAEFRVEIEYVVELATGGRSLSLGLPVCARALQNRLLFTVSGAGGPVQVTVKPSHALVTTGGGPRAADAVAHTGPGADRDADADAGGGSTSVECIFPSTHSLDIRWEERASAAEEEKLAAARETQQKKTLFTVDQRTLHAIGEGIVASTAVFEINIVHGTRSLLELAVEAGVNVLQVIGDSVRSWELVNEGAAAAPEAPQRTVGAAAAAHGDHTVRVALSPTAELRPIAATAAGGGSERARVLRVVLGSPTSSHRLTVKTERECGKTSGVFEVPSFHMLHADREKGQLALEAKTNVEIDVKRSRGLAKIDTQELHHSLSSLATLHAFKFLASRGTALSVNVTKHQDVSVLIAVVDDAWFTATVTADGTCLTKVVLNVRNTQKQYARLHLPEPSGEGGGDLQVWSTTVGGRTVKPAREDDRKAGSGASAGGCTLLVPLCKGSSDSAFVVEVVYLTAVVKMGSRRSGRLHVNWPKLDLPVSRLYASVFCPTGFRYGEFSGDLQEVKSLKAEAPSGGGGGGGGGMRKPGMRAQQMNRRGPPEQVQVQMQMPVSNMIMNTNPLFERAESISMLDGDSDNENTLFGDDALPGGGGGGGGAHDFGANRGVLPVRVADVRDGRRFNFERLLVQEQFLALEVPFRREGKSRWERRSAGSGAAVTAFGVAALLALAFAILLAAGGGGEGSAGAQLARLRERLVLSGTQGSETAQRALYEWFS